jgi:phosphoglycolate phosphatase
LRQNGLKLGIVSTKYRYRIEGILRRENLLEAFDVVIGGEDVAQHKPDPAGLQRAGELLNSAPAQMLYVGDSVVDAEAARRGGVAFAAVLSGVTSKEDFCRYPVAKVANDLTALADWLMNGMAAIQDRCRLPR